jgi:hypothetical protein
MFTLRLTDEEMEFTRQLFDSGVGVQMKHVDIAASLRAKCRLALPDAAPPSALAPSSTQPK